MLALDVLEGGQLIRSTRGKVTVRDPAGHEDYAADACGVPEAEYERVIAPMRKRDGTIVQGHFPQQRRDG